MSSTQTKTIPFHEATKATKLNSHTYSIDLHSDFCIGTVSNGGYTASCLITTARVHLSERKQPHTLTAHFEYPGRTSPGPAIITIEDIKISPQVSILHLSLYQGGLLPHAPYTTALSQRTVLAYTTHTNLHTFSGISLPTAYSVTPFAELPSPPDFDSLKKQGSDDTWEISQLPPRFPARSLLNWDFYMPKGEPPYPGAVDMWVRRSSGEKITQDSLAYVTDSLPYNINSFLMSPDLRQLLEASEQEVQKQEGKEKRSPGPIESGGLWYPTLVMNLEVKTALPDEGVEWLAVRVVSKEMQNGKFDLDVLVRNVDGEIIALGNQVALIVTMEQNTRKRKPLTKSVL